MIEISNVKVFNFEGALRGMRNPMNSWEKSDSVYGTYWGEIDGHKCFDSDGLQIGKNDLTLSQKLINGGPVHSKFMRQIFISMDINAPLYWWKEMDTYKVGTTANSCSTMHKIHSKEFTLDDFSYEKLFSDYSKRDELTQISLYGEGVNDIYELTSNDTMQLICKVLNHHREMYLETKDKKYWWQMIQLLPSSYNQKRTWTADYETLRNIYKWRKDHKLDEWHDFCKMIEQLPYGKELICYNKENANENKSINSEQRWSILLQERRNRRFVTRSIR